MKIFILSYVHCTVATALVRCTMSKAWFLRFQGLCWSPILWPWVWKKSWILDPKICTNPYCKRPPPLLALVPQEISSRDRIINPLLNYFIDQACSVKVTGDWPCIFCVFLMDLDFVSIREHTKQFGQCSANLTLRLVSDAYMYQRQFAKSGLIFLNVTILVYGNCYKYCPWLRKALNFLVIVFEFDM